MKKHTNYATLCNEVTKAIEDKKFINVTVNNLDFDFDSDVEVETPDIEYEDGELKIRTIGGKMRIREKRILEVTRDEDEDGMVYYDIATYTSKCKLLIA